ncbi:MAG: rRNA pseudouridine synthase [Chloroflexi bacterium]|nr:rRNA pseudouridine synthase [Chloroflexota bacterium]
MERLQKFLAHAGVASRRAAEELIRAGRVAVNGQVVTEMGVQVEPRLDRVAVDGRPIAQPEPLFYLALHKPRGYVATVRDELGRPTVMDLLHAPARLYPVGRLDADSEGLLLLTNDGELAHRLTHPSHLVDKEYHVLVAGALPEAALRTLRLGVQLEDGVTAPATVERLRREDDGATWLRIVLHEGRKRQIRRMVQAVGGRVLRLIRVRIDGIQLGGLEPGQSRPLADDEVARLRHQVGYGPRHRD